VQTNGGVALRVDIFESKKTKNNKINEKKNHRTLQITLKVHEFIRVDEFSMPQTHLLLTNVILKDTMSLSPSLTLESLFHTQFECIHNASKIL
jgi:hypothetical protein